MVVMTSLRLHCVAHNDNATVWPGNRTLYQQQTTLHIGLDNFQVECGDLVMTHVASHAQTFEYTTWK